MQKAYVWPNLTTKKLINTSPFYAVRHYVADEWLSLRISMITGSNPGPDTTCPDLKFFIVLLSAFTRKVEAVP